MRYRDGRSGSRPIQSRKSPHKGKRYGVVLGDFPHYAGLLQQTGFNIWFVRPLNTSSLRCSRTPLVNFASKGSLECKILMTKWKYLTPSSPPLWERFIGPHRRHCYCDLDDRGWNIHGSFEAHKQGRSSRLVLPTWPTGHIEGTFNTGPIYYHWQRRGAVRVCQFKRLSKRSVPKIHRLYLHQRANIILH